MVKGITIRRLNYLDDLVISYNTFLLIIDNGSDQTILNFNSFLVQSFVGIHFTIGGAFNIMASSNLELVNDAYTLVTLSNNTKVLF